MTISPVSESSSLLSRDYEGDSFVGRQDELKCVKKKIYEGLNGGPIVRPIIHFWGLPGIGRSWLLQHLEHECQHLFSRDFASTQKRPIVPVRVDFADSNFTGEDADIRLLLDCLFDRLPILGESLVQGALEELRQKYSNSSSDVKTLTESLVDCVKGAAECCVLLFLFDSMERLDAESFSWLERDLIAPLARTDRIIFVIAGRKELPRWKEFVVRQRLEVWEIQGFSLSETQAQLSRYGVPEAVLADIYPYTFGHPYANWALTKAWIPGAAYTPEKRCAFLEPVEQALLEYISLERERDILRTLSALRKFNVESARGLLGAMIDPEFETPSDGYYLRLFEVLEQSQLVYWDSDVRGYVIPSEVRFILQAVLRCKDAALYGKMHQQALSLYAQWFENYQGREEHFLPEILYHAARLHSGEGEDQGRAVLDLLQTYLAFRHFDAVHLDNFYRTLKDDRELEILLSPAIYAELLSQIEYAGKEVIR